ncbi:MAG: UDP-N-acetylmuramate--L-alanine ligase [bacterium]|nr:UDP-N-acetylmuramate--L-alanine ligase [bacterium]
MDRISHIYFVGIKGVAMTALALYLRDRGYRITGSDVDEKFPTDEYLEKAGIPVQNGFLTDHVLSDGRPDLVIYTGAHSGIHNVEVEEAISLGIPVEAHGKALGRFMEVGKQISVAGSHGKTTTTAILATILSHAGLDPSYVIGCGEVFGLGASGHYGTGSYFVAEADEYPTDPTSDSTPRFLWQKPDILIVTNVDYDHPDAYHSLAEIHSAFQRFLGQRKKDNVTILSADDTESIPLRDSSSVLVGTSDDADVRVHDVVFGDRTTEFTLSSSGEGSTRCVLRIPGMHNALNAAMAAVAARSCGVSWDDVKGGLQRFSGTKRRFEKIGEGNGVVLYDDYAHHPSEITATLRGTRDWYPGRRIISVFQPHTYSRTKALFSSFVQAFAGSDMTIITDVYGSAREKDTLGVDIRELVSEAKHHTESLYAKGRDEVRAVLLRAVKPGDVILFMGAGDIYIWARTLVKDLETAGLA